MVDQNDDRSEGVVRRLEVIAGGGGRKRWPPALKARIVADSYAPNAVVAEVARRYNARPQQVHDWRRDAREGRLAMAWDDPTFVPILAALTTSAPPAAAERGSIEIEIAGAKVRMRCPSKDALVDLFSALRRSSC